MTVFSTSRQFADSPERVFAAISNPERLARWWGPAGFTNTFSVCDFRQGGRWSFVMHGPDGGRYANESEFVEIEVPTKVVIQHVSEPRFRLTIGLTSMASGTLVSWDQAFENPEVADKVAHIVVPSNEQNLDRLTEEVARNRVGG